MPRLVNDEINELVDKLSHYQDNLSTAVYEQFKASLILAKTNNLRGKTGDSFKQYMDVVHIQLAEKIINIVHELHEAAKKMQTNFLNYENSEAGIVGSGTLENVYQMVHGKNQTFEQLDATSSQLLNRAAEFISTTKLPSESVSSAYATVLNNLETTREGLDKTDENAKQDLQAMKERVEQLFHQIHDLSDNFRDKNGIDYSKVDAIEQKDWYTVESPNGAFAQMLEDDPFIHNTGHIAAAEGQWVTGIDGDIYFAATGYVAGAQGHYTRDGYHIDTAGEFAALKGSAEGQFTEYATGSVEGELLAGEGSFTFGSDGIEAEGNVAVAKAEGTAMIGTETFNGYVTGKAEALTAEGQFTVKIPEDEDGDLKFALGGEATGAAAKVEAGLTLFGVEDAGGSIEIDGDKSSKSLLGIDATASAGFQASAGVEFSSETVFSNDYFNVRSNDISVDLSLVIGLKVDLQIPSIQIKWPW